MWTSKIDALDKNINKLKEDLKVLEEEKSARLAADALSNQSVEKLEEKLWTCPSCGRSTRIKNIVVENQYYYVSPYG